MSGRVKKKRNEAESNRDLIKVEGVDEKTSMDNKENVAPIQRRFNNNISVQMRTFIDRRVNTEQFLRSLEEKN